VAGSPDRLHLADRVREAANIGLTTWRDEIECAADDGRYPLREPPCSARARLMAA